MLKYVVKEVIEPEYMASTRVCLKSSVFVSLSSFEAGSSFYTYMGQKTTPRTKKRKLEKHENETAISTGRSSVFLGSDRH